MIGCNICWCQLCGKSMENKWEMNSKRTGMVICIFDNKEWGIWWRMEK